MDQSANVGQELEGHAYHYNLPPQFLDENDGLPLVTKYAYRKAQTLVEVAYSIKIKEELFVQQLEKGASHDKEEDADEVEDNEHPIVSGNWNEVINGATENS